MQSQFNFLRFANSLLENIYITLVLHVSSYSLLKHDKLKFVLSLPTVEILKSFIIMVFSFCFNSKIKGLHIKQSPGGQLCYIKAPWRNCSTFDKKKVFLRVIHLSSSVFSWKVRERGVDTLFIFSKINQNKWTDPFCYRNVEEN